MTKKMRRGGIFKGLTNRLTKKSNVKNIQQKRNYPFEKVSSNYKPPLNNLEKKYKPTDKSPSSRWNPFFRKPKPPMVPNQLKNEMDSMSNDESNQSNQSPKNDMVQSNMVQTNIVQTNIVQSNNTKPLTKSKVIPTIHVLPCLQEMKQGGYIAGYEYEQQPSRWNSYPPTFLVSGDASKQFNQYWSGKLNPNTDANVHKNGLLTIPDVSTMGFKEACSNMSCGEKWAMYLGLCRFKLQTDHNVALMITHHNRMRFPKAKKKVGMESFLRTQGLIPFINKKIVKKVNGKDEEIPFAYANNFCLKIEIKPIKDGEERIVNLEVNFTVENQGFPDKVGAYEYVNDTDNIDLSGIREGIDAVYKPNGVYPSNLKDLTLYLIRHGNALHNKPTGIKSPLDSSLTPLGMIQAERLGEKLKPQLQNKNILLCSSFLERAQHTGLIVLDTALKEMGPTREYNSPMYRGLEHMRKNALKRYIDSKEEIKKVIKDKLKDVYKPVAKRTGEPEIIPQPYDSKKDEIEQRFMEARRAILSTDLSLPTGFMQFSPLNDPTLNSGVKLQLETRLKNILSDAVQDYLEAYKTQMEQPKKLLPQPTHLFLQGPGGRIPGGSRKRRTHGRHNRKIRNTLKKYK